MIGVVLTTSQTELRICTAYGTEWCWGQVDCHATDISTLRLDVFQIPKRVIAGLLELSSTHEEGSECIRMMHRAFLADHAMVTDVDVQMCHANSGLVEALHGPDGLLRTGETPRKDDAAPCELRRFRHQTGRYCLGDMSTGWHRCNSNLESLGESM
jgi:hypothetical protein